MVKHKMDGQQLQTMKKMILSMFESKPGLREFDRLPPRWLLQTEIINLDEQEKYTLESAFNELHDSGLIIISKTEEDQEQEVLITKSGLDYISKNKADIKRSRKIEKSGKLNISVLSEDIFPEK